MGRGGVGGVGLEGDGRGLWGRAECAPQMVILGDFHTLVLKWREERRAQHKAVFRTLCRSLVPPTCFLVPVPWYF